MTFNHLAADLFFKPCSKREFEDKTFTTQHLKRFEAWRAFVMKLNREKLWLYTVDRETPVKIYAKSLLRDDQVCCASDRERL
jgi:hypothetical protein